MKCAILVSNSANGSAAAIDDGGLIAPLQHGGFEIAGRAVLPDDAPPERRSLHPQNIETVIICAGDGTVSGRCKILVG